MCLRVVHLGSLSDFGTSHVVWFTYAPCYMSISLVRSVALVQILNNGSLTDIVSSRSYCFTLNYRYR